jgi:hypothetical protein
MATSKYTLTGRVIRNDTGMRIHGLYIEAWDDDWSCDDCLGSSLTNRVGSSFKIQFSPADFKENFEGKPVVYLRIYDRDCRLIYDTRADKGTCHPHEPLQSEISLVPEMLW